MIALDWNPSHSRSEKVNAYSLKTCPYRSTAQVMTPSWFVYHYYCEAPFIGFKSMKHDLFPVWKLNIIVGIPLFKVWPITQFISSLCGLSLSSTVELLRLIQTPLSAIHHWEVVERAKFSCATCPLNGSGSKITNEWIRQQNKDKQNEHQIEKKREKKDRIGMFSAVELNTLL